MKTPHTIELFHTGGEPIFDPVTGEFKPNKGKSDFYPCLVNFMTKAKQFEEYGSRDEEIIIVRFNSEVPNFHKAVFKGITYKHLEESFVPRKKAYRLQKVGG
jgi:hypothetical protein